MNDHGDMHELVNKMNRTGMSTTQADEEAARQQSMAQQWAQKGKKWRDPPYVQSTAAREPQQQYDDDESEEEKERAEAIAKEIEQEEKRVRDSEISELTNRFGDFNDLTSEEEQIKKNQMSRILPFINKFYKPLNGKFTAYEVYHNPRIVKNKGMPLFLQTLGEFLDSEEKKSQGLRTIGSKRQLPSSYTSENSAAKFSAIEAGMGEGGNKSRRNTRRRRKSKKQKRVRHTRRKKTRRHRHSRRR